MLPWVGGPWLGPTLSLGAPFLRRPSAAPCTPELPQCPFLCHRLSWNSGDLKHRPAPSPCSQPSHHTQTTLPTSGGCCRCPGREVFCLNLRILYDTGLPSSSPPGWKLSKWRLLISDPGFGAKRCQSVWTVNDHSSLY